MLSRLSERISQCYERAAEAKQRADEVVDPGLKADFLGMEKRWLFLARSYEFVEKLKDFTSSRHQPIKPERSREVSDLTAMASLLLAGNSCADRNSSVEGCLADIVEAAIGITGADKGNLQVQDARSGGLTIAAQSGFGAAFLKFFECVTDEHSACGTAAASGERVVIEDVRRSEIFDGLPALKVLLDADVLAVQSTPLISSSGKLLGMISTHYKSPYRPTDRQLMFMDMLAMQAADYIERKQLEEVTQQRTEELEALLNVLPIPAWITTDPSCIEVRGNAAASALFNVPQAINVSQSSAPERAVILQHYAGGRLLSPEELPLQRALATGKTQKIPEIELEDFSGRRFALSGAAAPLFDLYGRARGAVAALADITDLRRTREHNEVLLRELQHRCNNLLSVVQMLVQRTLSDAASGPATLDEARPKLLGRLKALAHSTRQLTKSDWAGVSLLELVRATTETFSTRIEARGDEIVIAGKDAQNIALALHELATNAAKYGALTTPTGTISVSWAVEQSGSDKLLKVRWQERGGPLTTAPRRKGFGTTLISTVFSEASLDYAPDGLSCQFSLMITPPLANHVGDAALAKI